MNATAPNITLPAIGAPIDGGFFAGLINVNGQRFRLIRAPKAVGQHADTPWNKSRKRVDGATSYYDGLENTKAMAAAGSKVAAWALDQRINDHADWYIPAMDELEVLYRNLKPTTDENYPYGRSGLNVSAVPPTYPYTTEVPAQTPLTIFQAGGAEAFDPVWYWSSTQRAGDVDYAWCQFFGDGHQDSLHKDDVCRVVLVRRSPL